MSSNTDQVMASTSPSGSPTTIAVFTAASRGAARSADIYLAAARELGEVMAKRNVHLVYGGGNTGMMGEVAKTFVSLAGPDKVRGVMPTPMIAHEVKDRPDPEEYGPTTEVNGMHARKALMARLVIQGGPGSGFVALPGGFGTLEELAEMITWNQLGIHDKGIVLYNVRGYWDGLLSWLENAVDAGYVRKALKDIVVVANTAEEAVDALENYKAPEGRLKLEWADQF